MLLRGAQAFRYLAKPDPAHAGLLIFGADTMRVALKRQEAIAAIIGPEGEGEMRLTRLSGADLRKDPAILLDAVKAVGFFPGPRVAFVEDAGDGLVERIATALQDWRPGDAQIVVTAGDLKAKSALKTLFEKHLRAACIGIYNDPPSREEIEVELRRAGLHQVPSDAMADLVALAQSLDPGDFRQTLAKIGLYKWGDSTPLTGAEIAALAPATVDSETDDLLHAVAEGQSKQIGLLIRRLEAQGILPVTLCIQAMRHFRSLQIAGSDRGGVQAGMMKARVFGPRRDRMQKQLRLWPVHRAEAAIAVLLETDLTLRSSSKAPMMALMERALIRIAMMVRL